MPSEGARRCGEPFALQLCNACVPIESDMVRLEGRSDRGFMSNLKHYLHVQCNPTTSRTLASGTASRSARPLGMTLASESSETSASSASPQCEVLLAQSDGSGGWRMIGGAWLVGSQWMPQRCKNIEGSGKARH